MKTAAIGMGCDGRSPAAWVYHRERGRAEAGRLLRLEHGKAASVSGVRAIRVLAGRVWLTGVTGAGDLIVEAGAVVHAKRRDRLVLEGLPCAEVRIG